MKLFDWFKKKEVKKTLSIADTEIGIRPYSSYMTGKQKRGIQIYDASQVLRITGRTEDGSLATWGAEQPYFYLSTTQRWQMAQLSTPVFGIVTSRMNRISSIDFTVIPEKDKEDLIVDELKKYNEIYKEYKTDISTYGIVLKAKLYGKIKATIIDVKPDLSNFDSALLRWSRSIKSVKVNNCNEITSWLSEPNQGVTWTDFIKKFVCDLMIHGSCAVYKSYVNHKLENFDTLPGGTVLKMRAPYFSGVTAYIQAIPMFEPQIYFQKEMMFTEWLPISGSNRGMIPLESLINKVAESLFFDKLMAEQADGTKPPEKLVIVTNNQNPFGDLDKEEEIPLDPEEQDRIEDKMNKPRRGSIMTFSGNDAKVIDLSRENTMQFQNIRQKDIREEVALVFNMSNMEVNLTGSDGTSGRSTSESQAEIEQGKGIIPILKLIEEKITKEIIPYRFGVGYKMEFKRAKDDMREAQIDKMKQETGEETVNEMRARKNLSIFEGEEYNVPRGTSQQEAGADPFNPMFMKEIK